MAGFGDFLQAIQFGLGLAGGFATQAQQERQKNEASQLALLKLVKDDEHDLVPLSDIEAAETGPQGFLGKLYGAPGTADTFRVGGRAFKVVPKAPLDLGLTDDTIGAPTTATPVAPAPARGLPAYNPFGAPTPGTSKVSPTVQPQAKATTPGKFASLAAQIARKEGVPESLIPHFVANVEAESNFDPKAVSTQGAQGLGQLMPDTQTLFGVTDPNDPVQNLTGSAKYVKFLAEKFNNDPTKVFAAYNAGERRVDEYGGVPPFKETQAHVKRVNSLAPKYASLVQQQPGPFANQVAGPGAVGQVTSQQGDFSNLVAANDLTTPSAPDELRLQTPAETLQERQQRNLQLTLRRYQKLPNTRELRSKLIDLPDRVRKETATEYRQELNDVEGLVKTFLEREHDPRLRKLAKQVKTYAQLDELKSIKAQTPESDFLTQSDEHLRRMIALGQGDKAAIDVYQEGLRRNYTDAQIKHVLETAGYVDKKKLALKNEELKLEAEAALEKQRILAPGEVKLAEDKARATGPIELERERRRATDPELIKAEQAKAARETESALERERQKVTDPTLTQAERDKAARETMVALQKERLLKTDPTLNEAERTKRAEIAVEDLQNEKKKLAQATPLLVDRARQEARAGAEGRASVYTPSSPEMADELTRIRGERTDLPPETTIDELVKLEPETLTIARQNIDKRKVENDQLKQVIESDKPLTITELTRFIHPLKGTRAPSSINGHRPKAFELHKLGFIPVDAAAEKAIASRLAALDALNKMKLYAFGGTDEKGVKHPGVFRVHAGLGSRAQQSVSNFFKTLDQDSQEARDLNSLESLQTGLLSLYARGVAAETAQVSNVDTTRVQALFPTVKLAGLKFQSAERQAKQLYDDLEDLVVAPLNRIIGNGAVVPPTQGTEQTQAAPQNPSAPSRATNQIPIKNDAVRKLLENRRLVAPVEP